MSSSRRCWSRTSTPGCPPATKACGRRSAACTPRGGASFSASCPSGPSTSTARVRLPASSSPTAGAGQRRA
eukprot:3975054-Pleurochrysis_carterae.AAC.1